VQIIGKGVSLNNFGKKEKKKERNYWNTPIRKQEHLKEEQTEM